MLTSINPATGATISEYAESTSAEVNRALRGTVSAFAAWSRTALGERTARLARAAEILRGDTDRLARLITCEMGKPIREARAEIDKCAAACDYYAQESARLLADENIALGPRRALVALRPLGPLLAIMPWNFPFWQSFRASIPALATGNTVVLKLAANTTGSALAIEDVFTRAGFPAGVFTALRLPGAAMNRVIRHRAIAAVTLTGSTEAGRKVAAVAGKALKKTVLELGGSDPYVILADADVAHAAEVCAQARLVNGGQSCIAAKRFIVVDDVRTEFEERFVAAMRARVPGDPQEESTDLGPMARIDLRDAVHEQVQRAVAAGGEVVCGGQIPARPGAWYPPTVVRRVTPQSPAFREEVFGPVAAIVAARDEREAIALANQSDFGLGAAVFTRDVERGVRLAREELQCGVCAVNGFVASDPRVPFGGIRDSGHGRELGAFGPREFANIKTVLLA